MTDEQLADSKFTCDRCGGVFDEGLSDEAALAETAELYGKAAAENVADLAVVCDDCHNRMQAAYPAWMFQEDEAAGIERRIVLPNRPDDPFDLYSLLPTCLLNLRPAP